MNVLVLPHSNEPCIGGFPGTVDPNKQGSINLPDRHGTDLWQASQACLTKQCWDVGMGCICFSFGAEANGLDKCVCPNVDLLPQTADFVLLLSTMELGHYHPGLLQHTSLAMVVLLLDVSLDGVDGFLSHCYVTFQANNHVQLEVNLLANINCQDSFLCKCKQLGSQMT